MYLAHAVGILGDVIIYIYIYMYVYMISCSVCIYIYIYIHIVCINNNIISIIISSSSLGIDDRGVQWMGVVLYDKLVDWGIVVGIIL